MPTALLDRPKSAFKRQAPMSFVLLCLRTTYAGVELKGSKTKSGALRRFYQGEIDC
jgi:hypothetical protein